MLVLSTVYVCATGDCGQKDIKPGDCPKDESKLATGSEDKPEMPASLALLPGPSSLTARERTLSASQGSLKSIPDNDSSATLSADEGPPTRAGDGGGGGGQAVTSTVSPSMPGAVTVSQSEPQTLPNAGHPSQHPPAGAHPHPGMPPGKPGDGGGGVVIPG